MEGRIHNPNSRRERRRAARAAPENGPEWTVLLFKPRRDTQPVDDAEALRRRCGVPAADECRAELEQARRLISLAGHGLAFPPESEEAQLLDGFRRQAALLGEPLGAFLAGVEAALMQRLAIAELIESYCALRRQLAGPTLAHGGAW
jgi:hypothetical protein